MAKGLTRLFGKETIKEELRRFFKMRLRFLKRKQDVDVTYSYQTIDPYEVFGEEAARCGFTLVGDNWYESESTKPVAILFGFNVLQVHGFPVTRTALLSRI